jgi:GNAT superfamily N-acetyltransferase
MSAAAMSAAAMNAAAMSAAALGVRVRQAGEGDRTALAEMFARCSAQTRYRRFHGHVSAFPARYLTEALAGSPAHYALVACAGPGRVVALASCRTVAPGAAELGVLVEDRCQRRGIGGGLLREMAGYAAARELGTLKAQVLGDQSWLVRVLGEYGACDSVISGGVVDVTLRLRLLEHGDLPLAFRGERRLVPPRPAMLEAEPRDPGHQVELGRPHVTVGRGVLDQAAADFHPVM